MKGRAFLSSGPGEEERGEERGGEERRGESSTSSGSVFPLLTPRVTESFSSGQKVSKCGVKRGEFNVGAVRAGVWG